MIIEFDQEDFEKRLNLAFKGIALDTQEALKDKLTQEHGVDTGDLKSSIFGHVEGNDIIIDMAEHALYVEYGVPPGHMPPVEALEGWAQRKLGDKKKAWAVAMAIKKRGLTPYPFLRNTFHKDVTGIIKKNLKKAFR